MTFYLIMDAQQIDSWVQMMKKHNTHAQGHIQRENAQLEHAEAPYSHFARHILEEVAFGGLSANQVHNLTMMSKWQTLG